MLAKGQHLFGTIRNICGVIILSFEIEIQEGHNGSSYFWFRPIIFKRHDKVGYDDVVELEEEFSIEEENIGCFLSYFFFKYYDAELIYNKKRYNDNQEI